MLYSYKILSFSPYQFSSVARSCLTLRPHGLQHVRLPCPSPTPRVCSNSCPSNQWCHPTISSSVIPFSSCPQSSPASGSCNEYSGLMSFNECFYGASQFLLRVLAEALPEQIFVYFQPLWNQRSFSLDSTYVIVQSPSRVQLFATPWITTRQAPLSITNSRSSLKFMSSSQWCQA